MLHSLAKRIAVFLIENTDEYSLDIYTYGLQEQIHIVNLLFRFCIMEKHS